MPAEASTPLPTDSQAPQHILFFRHVEYWIRKLVHVQASTSQVAVNVHKAEAMQQALLLEGQQGTQTLVQDAHVAERC